MTTATEEAPIFDAHQEMPKHRNVLGLIGTSAAILITGAGVAFGIVQSSNANHAYVQNNQLSHQISQLQSEIDSMQRTNDAQRNAAVNAGLAHLGVCVDSINDPMTGDVQYISIQPPAKSGNGVYSCNGGSYVSVVPQPPQSG